MSNLSELLPAGGGGKNVDFVASGTLGNGKTVILNSDGTVSLVGISSTSIPESIPAGAGAIFNPAEAYYISAAFDPNTAGKFVVSYHDQGNSAGYGTAVVGTVSGTSISFGSEYVFNSGVTQYTSVAFDPNTAGKFVIAYQDSGNSSYGTCIVGTVSGTSITFGSEYVFNSGNSSYISMSFDPNTAGKFVVAYKDGGNSYYGTAVVGTVSGTAISFGSEYVFNSGGSSYNAVSFDPNTANKFVVTYRDTDNSDYGTAVVGTVSGTSISYGSEYVFNSGSTYYTSIAFEPNTAGKFVVAYKDGGNSDYGTACVGTISGTSISFGSEYVFNSADSRYNSIAFDPNTANKFVVTYRDKGNSYYGTAVVGTVSGTSISYGSEVVFNSGNSSHISAAFDPNTAGKFVVAYKDGNSNYGTAILGQLAATVSATNLTATNFLGITDAAITSGASGSVTIKGGLKSELSSLTPNSIYYVQTDGSVTTVSTAPAVRIGKALSSTTLNLEFSS